MTYREAVKEFEYICSDLYIKQVDYWTGQLAWSEFVDGLCKEGRITQKQYSTWETPFPYGKRLSPKRKQLERKVYETDM